MKHGHPGRLVITACLLLAACSPVRGQVPEPVPDESADQPGFRQRQRPPLAPLPEPLRRLTEETAPLNPGRTVLLDLRNRRLFLHTEVTCRDCILEMLCVPIGQREHETILNVRSKAYVVHAGLLALDLKPGKSVVFYPEYQPPEGPVLRLTVHWVDEDGQPQQADARSWIRHSIHRYFARPLAAPPPGIKLPHEELRYDPYNKEILWYGPMTTQQREHLLGLWDDEKYQEAIQEFFRLSQSRPMQADFVFTGSRWTDAEVTGQRRYMAEDGHFITVANFPAATIDIAEKSTAADGAQTYEAWTDRIPPDGTPVLLEITAAGDAPQQPPAAEPAETDTSESADSPPQNEELP